MTSNSRKARAERILSGSALANLVSMVVMFFPLSALSAAQDEVEIELFTGPSTAKMVSPVYPRSRQRDGAEGWVQLNFMVGVEGNAYEVAVSDSTGDESFEKAAIKAVQRSKFEPASMNGEPTDAGHALKIVFSLRGAHGASRKFVNAYKQLMKAIAADDRQKSDALVTELQAMAASNLYEDAYLHVARFVYLQKWGDSHQQLNSLMRAVAYEQSDSYLPEKVYRSVLGSLFALQVETRDYSGALRTFDTLSRQNLDENTMTELRATVARIKALREQGTTYAVPGRISKGYSWYFPLFMSTFSVVDVEGAIAEVKLRCDSDYVFFRFQPALQYSIAEKSGKCNLELLGDPGTTFSLVQM